MVEGVGWTAVLPGEMVASVDGTRRRRVWVGVVRIFLDGFLSRGHAAWECVSSQGWEGNYFIKMVGVRRSVEDWSTISGGRLIV